MKTRKNQLVQIVGDRPVTTSLAIANHFGKHHKDVLRAIRNLDCSKDFKERNFAPCMYTSNFSGGVQKQNPMYTITRDGFTFLAMGFTGKVAARFKEDYINAFNAMERKLSENLIDCRGLVDRINFHQGDVFRMIQMPQNRFQEMGQYWIRLTNTNPAKSPSSIIESFISDAFYNMEGLIFVCKSHYELLRQKSKLEEKIKYIHSISK